jgi:hypothetical protein
MMIGNDGNTQARRNTWRRETARTRPTSVLRIARAPTMPAMSLAELLNRLSQGQLSPELAADLLRIDANDVTLHIEIDRGTGLVSRWNLHTGSAPDSRSDAIAEQVAPAA